jgi:3'-phosphoadenosine 5'-phosphosulfate sulfotransferase (PAPS reductase)/FAD synthetase
MGVQNMRHVIFASGGNDSVALVQCAKEACLTHVTVCYSNTGWAVDWWPERVAKFKAWVVSYGYSFVEIDSEGMINLVHRKKAWPSTKPKFCTYELKIAPAMKWLDEVDPNREATCMVGVRREEGEKNASKRLHWPMWIEESEAHGGRSLHSPLVLVREQERNALIHRGGWEVLPHRSRECWPCVAANKDDIQDLRNDPKRIDLIDITEKDLGPKRTLFRPAHFRGATGIHEVVKWACGSVGQYSPGQAEFGCDAGFCGD